MKIESIFHGPRKILQVVCFPWAMGFFLSIIATIAVTDSLFHKEWVDEKGFYNSGTQIPKWILIPVFGYMAINILPLKVIYGRDIPFGFPII